VPSFASDRMTFPAYFFTSAPPPSPSLTPSLPSLSLPLWLLSFSICLPLSLSLSLISFCPFLFFFLFLFHTNFFTKYPPSLSICPFFLLSLCFVFVSLSLCFFFVFSLSFSLIVTLSSLCLYLSVSFTSISLSSPFNYLLSLAISNNRLGTLKQPTHPPRAWNIVRNQNNNKNVETCTIPGIQWLSHWGGQMYWGFPFSKYSPHHVMLQMLYHLGLYSHHFIFFATHIWTE